LIARGESPLIDLAFIAALVFILSISNAGFGIPGDMHTESVLQVSKAMKFLFYLDQKPELRVLKCVVQWIVVQLENMNLQQHKGRICSLYTYIYGV